MTTKRVPIADRFWPKVNIGGPNECWNWTAFRNKDGYGTIGVCGRKGTMMLAHRASYEIHHGSIPDGLIVMHTCDNPACVNPAHLRTGTHSNNSKDSWDKGRCKLNPSMPGASHPNSTITQELSEQIRSAYLEIPNQEELSIKFGISKGNVWNIVTGIHWTTKGQENLPKKYGRRRRWYKKS